MFDLTESFAYAHIFATLDISLLTLRLHHLEFNVNWGYSLLCVYLLATVS